MFPITVYKGSKIDYYNNKQTTSTNIMNIYTVTVYTGGLKERIEVRAQNQAVLRQRVAGMGYDRLGTIHRVDHD